MVRFERSSLAKTEVLGLVIPQFGDVRAKPRQMHTGRVFICKNSGIYASLTCLFNVTLFD